MNKGNKCDFTASFSLDLFTEGLVSLPAVLLRCYANLGLSELQMMIIIQMIRLYQEGRQRVRPEDMQLCMSARWEEIQNSIADLIERGFITVQNRGGKGAACCKESYTLHGLFDQLAEMWVVSSAPKKENVLPGETKKGDDFGRICSLFEKEFGRLLSPMESTQIAEWLFGEAYSDELVAESLKRAVLRGILNFKYIDSILREWRRNNVRTTKEIADYEQRYLERREQNKKKNLKKDSLHTRLPKKKKKYQGIYMN